MVKKFEPFYESRSFIMMTAKPHLSSLRLELTVFNSLAVRKLHFFILPKKLDTLL
jgi:hypothetical protein